MDVNDPKVRAILDEMAAERARQKAKSAEVQRYAKMLEQLSPEERAELERRYEQENEPGAGWRDLGLGLAGAGMLGAVVAFATAQQDPLTWQPFVMMAGAALYFFGGRKSRRAASKGRREA